MINTCLRQANDLKESFERRHKQDINRINAYINLDEFTITIPDPLFPDEPTVYIPTTTGLIFHRSDDRVRVVRGHVGSGKTTMECAEIIFRIASMPPCRDGIRHARCAIIRNTYGDLIKTTLHTWRQWYNRLGHVKSVQSPSFSITHTFKAEVTNNGQTEVIDCVLELLPIALDTAIDVTKHLKSLEVTFAFLNELSELDSMVLDFFTGGRMPRFPRLIDFSKEIREKEWKGYWSGLFSDTNPPPEDHWIYQLFEVEKPPQYTMLVQPPAVIKQGDGYIINPEAENIKNILNGKEEYIKMTYGKSENFIRVYLMGEYGTLADEKRVYYNYNDNIHSSDHVELNSKCPLIIAADLGTVAPAIGIAQIVEGRLLVIKEFCGQFMTIAELCENAVRPWLNTYCKGMGIEVVLHDPADTYDGADQLREFFGVLVTPAETNNVEQRIYAVSQLLNKLVQGQGALEVSRNGCPQLRKGFNGLYHYRRLRIIGEERYTDEPHKNHPYSDCLSAGTKITMADKTEMNIEDIKPGMMVLTPNGIRKVTRAWLVRKNAFVWEYLFNNGSKLIATPDHRMFTNNGWKKICDLRYDDVLYSFNNAEVKLVSKRLYQERKNIYDLTVEIDHCFFANSLLVHNCHDALQYIALYANKQLQYGQDETDELEREEFKRNRSYDVDRITGY